jgi:excisionase family DNA binding protein
MSQDFYTIPEAAQRLKVHADTISAMGKRGDITIVSIGRARRVVAASIDFFVERQSRQNSLAQAETANVKH